MKKLCVSLMAFVALLCVSCSNDPEIPEKNDNGIDVTLSITTSPLTKAVDDNQVEKKAPIDASKALIVYFMDASSSTVASYKLTGEQITAIQSGSGFKFTNLDPSVVNVYVVANVHSSTLPDRAPGTTLTAINAKAQNISDQQTANAASVVLANTGKTATSTSAVAAPNNVASNGNAQFEAKIELTPIVSRIQIKKVSADATITSFKLEGIYIDNFYPQMTIGGAFTSITIQHATDKATFDATKAPYITTNLYDESASGLEKNPFGAATPQVYGYQIFPTTSTAHENVPYIILKISGITTTSNATRNFPDGTYYVAVKAYKEAGTSAAPVTSFLPGNIYTVEDIVVSEKNIVTDPTKSLINVTVNVTVKAWESTSLNPDFGY